MNKILLTLLCTLFSVAVSAQSDYKYSTDAYFNKVIIQVDKPGTLEKKLQGTTLSSLTGLKVIGPLNQEDMELLSWLATKGTNNGLHSINLHDANLESIPAKCFKGTFYLMYFYMPQDLKEIGDEAFSGSDLQHIDFPASLKKIGKKAFFGQHAKKLTIPAAVESIGDGAFAAMKDLKEVTVATGNTAFKVTDGLLIGLSDSKLIQCFPYVKDAVTIPAGTKRIGDAAFHTAKFVTSISIPASIEQIGTAAFSATYALTSIDVAAANTHYVSDGGVLFNKEKSILLCYPTSKTGKAYTVPNSVTEIAASAFTEAGGQNSKAKPGLQKVVVQNGVVKIGDDAFNFSGISEITLPTTLREIGANCFYYTNVEDVTIPEGVKRIEAGTFEACYSLTTLTLPSTMEYIGAGFLSMCDAIATINVYAQTPPTCDRDAFGTFAGSVDLHVVKGARKAYNKHEAWGNAGFNDIIDDLEVVTGIEMPTATPAAIVEVARYNATGARLNAPEKGLNIVKMSDGRTMKVIVR